MQQSLEIIRRRVDETGTREPSIQRQGADRILIQVPGIGSAEELLAIIGQTARLSFHPVVQPDHRRRRAAGARRGDLSERRRAGRLLRARAARGGHRRAAGRQPAVVRPERPAGGRTSASTRRAARPSARYTAENIGSPVRDRARRGGDLGAGDPEPHRRRLGHHHRQLHARGIDPPRDPAARRRAAGRDHRARAAHDRAGARPGFDRGRAAVGGRRDCSWSCGFMVA